MERENYKNGQIRYLFFYCNDACFKAISYKSDGTLYGIRNFAYNKDTVVVTNFYRKDGSKIIYERQVNNKDDGNYFIYYPDGSIKLEAKNVNGIRVYEKTYDEFGMVTSESKCNTTGENCTATFYDKNGNIKKKNTFKYKGTKFKLVF